MTEEDDMIENFDEKTQEEKLNTLRRLHKKMDDDEFNGLIQQLDIEGELTVTVYDEDGNEKQKEKEEF